MTNAADVEERRAARAWGYRSLIHDGARNRNMWRLLEREDPRGLELSRGLDEIEQHKRRVAELRAESR